MSNAISSSAGLGALLSGVGSGKTAADKAAQTRESQETAIVDAISMNTVPIDIASYGAIVGSVTAAGGVASHGAGEAAAVQDVMSMIGKTLSQGQGAYYLAINVPGDTLATAMTPGQLQAYMQSGGTLYPDTVTSSDGQTYSLQGLLKQAFAANERAEQMRAADPAMDNPYMDGAEALLDQMRADSSPPGSQRSVLFGSNAHDPDTAKTIRTLVLQMGGGGADSVQLTIVYFPPGSGSLAAAPSAQQAPSRLQLTA
ncbi:hypothetical protein [Acidisphaera sp. S103]|uniref:hypothetical protein n=1 Tax=Acidisphaera sp. S103 TaxID=1747223 RepID=UPI00131E3589|nr:hypothetical protein [Acidisphaera sp. S103]